MITEKPGRTSDEEITMLHLTGIALQELGDRQRAMAAGVGIEKKMIST